MNDLISRQALRSEMYHEAFEKDSDDQRWDSGCWIRYRMFERVVDRQPSAQRTGRWIDTDTTWSAITDNATIQIPAKICSECGKPIPQIMWKNYCPNCGARMEVEE